MYKETKEIHHQILVRTLNPDDYDAWNAIAESAWGIENINRPWDFTALVKDNHVSVALSDGDAVKGASLNLLKIGNDGLPYLLVHMLAVHAHSQNDGLGKLLMDANYALIREGKIAHTEIIKLTSDPMDSRNVRLYLHKCRMHANVYIPEAYKGLETEGGEKHLGLPADRLYYQCCPSSPWVRQGIVPTQPDYARLVSIVPDVHSVSSQKPIILIETPADLISLKNESSEKAVAWRMSQREQLSSLFNQGYTAVDHVMTRVNDVPRQHIVCLKGFNEHDPYCLIRAVQKMEGI